MTSPAEPLSEQPSVTGTPLDSRWMRIEEKLARIGDWLNPILVKETRQALKGRQFVITFTLLLIGGWIWSILGLGFGPEVGYSAMGPRMFVGYYLILAIPLVVVVPFGAFRSLTVEQEDRTYELMSITALNPRQIITGKLVCSVAQMLLYLSAISPCLAFTYLLRGIDVMTIVFGLVYVVAISLGLSMVGLLVGTLTNERHWQVLLSVAMIVGLLAAFGGTSAFGLELLREGLAVEDADFWISVAVVASVYASYFALFFHAAVARITFTSENRSTPLRRVMVVQFVLFSGWFAMAVLLSPGETELLLAYLVVIFLHWSVMGIFMTGESPELSLRVRRQLPRSLLARMLLTWFNPGPATGYLFAVSGAIAATILVFVGVAMHELLQPGKGAVWGGGTTRDLLTFALLGSSYLVIYLGAGLLVLRGLRKLGQSGMLLTVLIHILLVMAGCGLPVVLDMALSNSPQASYSYLQTPNFIWTLAQIATAPPMEAPVLRMVIPGFALAVFVLNLPGIVRAVEYVRIAKPARVAEEDAQIAAELHPPELVQISPWDMEMRP